MRRDLRKGVGVLICCAVALLGCQAGMAESSQLPDIPDMSGKVLTVTGPVDPNVLGPTLMHEHVFVDPEPTRPRPLPRMSPAQETLYRQPLTLSNLYQARYGVGVDGMNTIANFGLVHDEVLEFRKWGGGTIVDATSIGLSRDPRALAHLSRVTGLRFIMGSGWYRQDYYPADMKQRTIDDLVATIVRDIVVGANGTGIRSGIIGEIVVGGDKLSQSERTVIRAAARASRITGAALSLRYDRPAHGSPEVLDMVAFEGADLSRVIMQYRGKAADDMQLIRELLERGVYVEFARLGMIGGPRATFRESTDRDKAKWIASLIESGYADRILLGQDIHMKFQLKAYGGTGYSYIPGYFLPSLRRLGVSEEAIHKIMVENPRRILTFARPRP